MSESATELNERQEKFCWLYTSDKEFFGNGAQSYIEVYDIDQSKPNWFKTAAAAASRLLTNVNICQRINELLESNGLSNEFVDKQTLFLITQHADFTSKLGAIREYNKLKARIVEKTEVDHNLKGNVNIGITTYAVHDPLQLRSSTSKPTSDPRLISSSTLSSPQLASESTEDDTSSQ